MLQDAETYYTKMENLTLALVLAARKPRPYFQAYHIMVITDYPLQASLAAPDISGRMAKLAALLGKYGVVFRSRTTMKGWVLIVFFTNFPL